MRGFQAFKTSSAALLAGSAVLAAVWLGPLPALARQSFAAHMSMHMAVVAVAAPLVALAIAGTTLDPARAWPRLFAPIPASMVEFLVVWIWHVPALHQAARHEPWALVLEQVAFLAAGLFLWTAAVGGSPTQQRLRSGAGVVGLLFTSMHMTLLGALFALAPRLLYPHIVERATGLSAIADQHLGGAIMLLVGGASYLAGGLWLTAVMLRPSTLRPFDPSTSSGSSRAGSRGDKLRVAPSRVEGRQAQGRPEQSRRMASS